ncbi:MAG: hypothetical protein ABIT05_05120 [Chitinophagaceae bacterium]
MAKFLQGLHPIVFLLIATILEVTGDAIIRKSMYNHTGTARILFGLTGAILLFGYGFFLNLAPVEFGKVVGLYIATLFVVWQVITYITFKSVPSLPIIVGGALVVLGGLIITFWKPK